MHNRELELLIREYANAVTNQDKLIKRKLDAIAALCGECGSDEFVFANEITLEFCRLIRLLQQQQEKAAGGVAKEKDTASTLLAGHLSGFVPYRHLETDGYECGEQLLAAFYNYFKKDEEVEYDQIRFLKNHQRKEKLNATLTDYVARIYTFCTDKNKEYLFTIFSPEEIGTQDPVLFVYRNIEIILAKFNTKDNGVSVKQKVNIRSALRKLNEFKRAQETGR